MGVLEQIVTHDEDGRFRVPEGGRLLSTAVTLLFAAGVGGLILNAALLAYADGRVADAALGGAVAALLVGGVLVSVGRRLLRWAQGD